MKPTPLRDRVLEKLRAPDYRPLDKVELTKALGMHSSERRQLREVLGALEAEGAILRTSKDLYILPGVADVATGTLQVHGGGNAHLLSETPGVKDLFVPAAHLGTAMHGDKVVVRIERSRRGDQEGRVIRVLERVNSRIVGILQRSKNFFYVKPDDARMQRDVNVPSAKTAQVGDKVVVQLEPCIDPHLNPEGEII